MDIINYPSNILTPVDTGTRTTQYGTIADISLGNNITNVMIGGLALTFGYNGFGALGQGTTSNTVPNNGNKGFALKGSFSSLISGYSHMVGISANVLYS